MMDTDVLKVMIVDDEEIARNFLRICIDWNEIGMDVICEASGGSEAIELIEKFNPDIIFTDIHMQFMDGLELSKIISETYPHIRIVILTAYKEFDYARKGIEIGVSDFLLKPINKLEVLKISLNIKEEIEAEKKHWNEFNQIKKQLDDNYEYMREKFLIEMLGNSTNIDNLEEKMNYFYHGIIPSFYQVALIETSHSDNVKDIDEEKRLLLGLESIESVKKYFEETKNVYVLFDNSRRIIILTNNPEIDLVMCIEQLKAIIVNRIKCYVSIGVGNCYNECCFMSKTYKEALDALKYSIVLGRNHVTCFNDEMRLNGQCIDFREEEFREISFCVKAGLDGKAISILENAFSKIVNSKNITIEQVRVMSINIISAILGAVSEMGVTYGDVYVEKELPYNKIFEIDTLINMEEYLKNLILLTTSSVKIIRNKKSKKVIDNIIDYVKANFSDYNLSLSYIASKFYVNASYLSRIFKQETGQSFTEYILRLRMEKAIVFLRETELKAYQVAEAVGIKDPYYFSNCFKKFTGLSVNEYKKLKETK
jgi:two-component system response regulator YesN